MTRHSATSTATRIKSVWCLIDRSGSMNSIREDVVGGFDSFIADQTAMRHDGTLVTVAQFDTDSPYDVIAHRTPLERVRSIGPAYRPRGGTPLFDAIGTLLDHAERAGRGEDRLIVIITDGHENASRIWTRQALFRRISSLRERGWTFVFIGANQDSYATGSALGFGHGSVTNFAGDRRGARVACESLSRATGEWRAKAPQQRHRDEARFFGDVKEAEDDLRHRTPPVHDLWSAGFPCPTHDTPWCPECTPADPDVLIVAGGSAYHRTTTCAGLVEGQRSVGRRGGTPAPIRTVRRSTAKGQGRSACQVCNP